MWQESEKRLAKLVCFAKPKQFLRDWVRFRVFGARNESFFFAGYRAKGFWTEINLAVFLREFFLSKVLSRFKEVRRANPKRCRRANFCLEPFDFKKTFGEIWEIGLRWVLQEVTSQQNSWQNLSEIYLKLFRNVGQNLSLDFQGFLEKQSRWCFFGKMKSLEIWHFVVGAVSSKWVATWQWNWKITFCFDFATVLKFEAKFVRNLLEIASKCRPKS